MGMAALGMATAFLSGIGVAGRLRSRASVQVF
jgi:hypothetical protein